MKSKEEAAARLFIEKIKPYVTKETEYNSEVHKKLMTTKLYEAINEIDDGMNPNLVFLYAEKELVELQLEQLKGMKK